MSALADAGLLFALLVEGHAGHPAALRWWGAQADATVGLCLPVRLQVLHLLSDRHAMQGSAVAPHQALAAWQQLMNDPRALVIDRVPAGHEACFTSLVRSRAATSHLWSNAWLAALALSLDVPVVSFDRGLCDFHPAKVRVLAA